MNTTTLPIEKHLDEFAAALQKHQAVVLVGEPGTGKSTLGPIGLRDAGFAKNGLIGVVEPRRLAAISVAKYVAWLLGSEIGDLIGYQIRFDDQTSSYIDIKFMTDGILLEEAKGDLLFMEYSVLAFDEVQELGLNMIAGLGLAKRALALRDDLRVVAQSATINPQLFSDYFGGAPIVEIKGEMYKVDPHYLEDDDEEKALAMFRNENAWDDEPFTLGALAAYTVDKIYKLGLEGDIIIFMPGWDEILKTIEYIEMLPYEDLLTIPVHGEMSPDDQQRIYEEAPGYRRIIIGTPILDASITVDAVHAIDSGLIKQMEFNPKSGISRLRTVEASKAILRQRERRVGRIKPGHCWRLFKKEEYDDVRWEYRDFEKGGEQKRPDFPVSELKRSDLAGFVLRLIGLGIWDVENFDLIEAPPKDALHHAYETLVSLGTLSGDRKTLSPLGWRLHSLPVEPRIGMLVLAGEDYRCLYEMCTIAAYRSSRGIFVRPKGKEKAADKAKWLLRIHESDFLTMLDIIRQFEENGEDPEWTREHFLNRRTLREIINIRNQLLSLLENRGITITSVDYRRFDPDLDTQEMYQQKVAAIGKALTVGLLHNLSVDAGYHQYSHINSGYVWIHPSSVVFGADPKIMVCGSIVETKKPYARDCHLVKLEWVEEVAPHLLKVEYHDSYFSGRHKQTKLCGVVVKDEEIKVEESAEESVEYDSGITVDDMVYDSTESEPDTVTVVGLTIPPAPVVPPYEPDPVVLEEISALEAKVAEIKVSPDKWLIKPALVYSELRVLDNLLYNARDDIQYASSAEYAREELEKAKAEMTRFDKWHEMWIEQMKAFDRMIAIAEQEVKAWQEYEAQIEAHKQWPRFGQYRFSVDDKGNPKSYKDIDGFSCQFDWDSSEELPEEGKAYWGFVTQEANWVRKIALLFPVREQPSQPMNGKTK